MSIKDLPITQAIHLRNQKPHSLLVKLHCPRIDLSSGDGEETFGLTEAFKKYAINLPQSEPEIEVPLWKSALLMMEAALEDCVSEHLSAEVLRDCTNDVMSSELAPPENGSETDDNVRPRKRTRRKTYRIPHAPGDDSQHKTKFPPSTKKSRDGSGVKECMQMWQTALKSLSPSFSMAEKALLRYLVLHVSINGSVVDSIADLDTEHYDFDTLEKVWKTISASLQKKGSEFSQWVRLKSAKSLRDEMKKQATLQKYQWQISCPKAKEKEKRILGSLVDGAADLAVNVDDESMDWANASAQTANAVVSVPSGGSTAKKLAHPGSPGFTVLADDPVAEKDAENISRAHVPRASRIDASEDAVFLSRTLLHQCFQTIEEARSEGKVNWLKRVFPSFDRMGLNRDQQEYVRKHYRNSRFRKKLPRRQDEDTSDARAADPQQSEQIEATVPDIEQSSKLTWFGTNSC